jgi:hypothetical protein
MAVLLPLELLLPLLPLLLGSCQQGSLGKVHGTTSQTSLLSLSLW